MALGRFFAVLNEKVGEVWSRWWPICVGVLV